MKIAQRSCYTLGFVCKALAHRHAACLGRALTGSGEGNQASQRRMRRRDRAEVLRGSARAWVRASVCLSACTPTESRLLLLRHCNPMQTVSYIEKLPQ